MFANFLYFLVALIIYSTSPIILDSEKASTLAIIYTIVLSVIFTVFCHVVFKRLLKRIPQSSDIFIDHILNRYITNLSMLSLVVFSITIYVFRLPLLFSENFLFKAVPTIQAVFFMALFLLYLVIVWAASHAVQQRIFPGSISRKAFIRSNISFSLPALLPWFIISIFSDMIQFLPYEPIKSYLMTPQGEITYILLFLIPIAIFGPVLIARLWGCTPLRDGEDRSFIEQVCVKAGLPYKNILTWNLFGGSMITAGVMGLVGKFRYILVTPALLNVLNYAEIEAVILHEIGHVQKKHMLFYLVFFVGFMLFIYFLMDPLLLLIYMLPPVYQAASFFEMDSAKVMGIFSSLVLIGLFIVYFRYIFGFFMRNFERQADIHLYSFMNNAWPLVSTFHKIAAYSRQSPDKPSWHHFSISERISFLNNCQEYPDLIKKHHQKIRNIMTGYLIIMSIACFSGYSISYGKAKAPFEMFITKQLLLQKAEISPDNPELYEMIADYYYSQKNFKDAKDAYQAVLSVSPENLHALNNLSWLLSTCPDPAIVDPEKALELSKRAMSIQAAPYILDTYAQACFVNKRYKEAVEASKTALDQTTENKDYYQKQYQFFKENYKVVPD